MFGWDESRDAYNQAYDNNGQPKNEGSLGHEVIAGAASFAAMKVYEDHQRGEGKQVNHAFAKELIAGFAGGEVDKLAETKGEDFVDREEAKHKARKNAEHLYDQHYGGDENFNPERRGPHPHLKEQFGGGNNW